MATILVVDDVVGTLLESRGHRVLEACEGNGALVTARRERKEGDLLTAIQAAIRVGKPS